jgi:hypothetical protein
MSLMVPEMAVKKLLTGARLKFPILEQGSNIQRAFSVRLAILKRVLDSGLSGLMDVLSCRILGKPSLVPAQDRARPQSAEAGANMEGEGHKIGAALNAKT